ncbi:1,4-dihydroxy-2-naphthoate polyprenyltransferase [Enterococcus sp. DIV0242_7C1]|uniref:1,4-dihydroxy-2-naphthoate octaprenyltransferase n=1 Tax=Candidatus Enterococcus dunnyi TaxID=1834192 RepID=A0A200J7K3_9ENTE|nr:MULTISPECIES: 1,4-dihydroxy-2-naphthoate polyprenyltransferase [unclassified Enterococcus]MBO0471444.1 1,4-dihydroxy-2-naphthoate polyprenyltransferase [Enterococcus sp. DIV0242_7C1]OUZ32607.1 1,4-dihydroxy-2-naphthoate octaprenyltransferase [Enterococcus sp. 9D6_DIV0238]
MSLKVFLQVVEIQTKLASLFPFAVGVLFSIAYFNEFQLGYTLLFFVGMVVFDMATTAINNFMDFKKAKSQKYKYEENIIGSSGIAPSLVRNMIFAMITFAAAVGIFLTIQTGWLFLVMGGVCCFIGIFYTFGPIPLSRMPLGEVFSGFTMGLGIFAMTIYLNVLNDPPFYLQLDWVKGTFALIGSLWSVLAIIWASLPMVFTIANIMLANNLRDLDTDIENHRYTLVYYIGREHGVILFQGLMLACYAVILVGMVFGIYQWPILLTFVSLLQVWKNLKLFKAELPHPKSFGYSIKNLIAFNGCYLLGLLVTIVVKKL